MKSISGKVFAKIIEKKGWFLLRISGSHHIYAKEGRKERISLPIHGNHALKPGLLNFFMKVAGLKEIDL
jgi:predicted RNA binding protein YcfA (HicA-like mRNA interferase family)